MLRAAVLQMKSQLGQLEYNRNRAIELAQQAAVKGAKLIVLPELWPVGYHLTSVQFYHLAESLSGPTVSTFCRLAQKYNLVMIVPFPESFDGRFYISAAVIDSNGDLLGVHRKSFLWGRESKIFATGPKKYCVFETSSAKIGILICYDAEFPEPSRILAQKGAEIIVVPSVWSLQAENRWDIQLPARALDNTVFVIGANTVGSGACGKSKFIAPDGKILKEAPGDKETILIANLDLDRIKKVRLQVPYLDDIAISGIKLVY